MGREVRRVPKDWEHPKFPGTENYIPLLDGKDLQVDIGIWDTEASAWERGEYPDYADEEDRKLTYEEWSGPRPNKEDYMPQWKEEECTHLMMYESTSKGTPLSPAFETPEELARWLTDNKVSAFGDLLGSYEGWLRVAKGGWTPGAVYTTETGFISGVEAAMILPKKTPKNGEQMEPVEKSQEELQYWSAKCMSCGWEGSSKHLLGGKPIADTGDYGEVSCPSCGSTMIEDTESMTLPPSP